MEYKVIYMEGSSLGAVVRIVQKQVNEHLASGWTLQGGVAISQDSMSSYHAVCQALVKTIAK